ncbi:hypothetical protein N665_0065s0121 [Sinapis alba]|nr:hypothetical protein N665_0065s0121 [Sinapis alba]
MWRLRRTEIEFDERLKRKSREESSSGQSEQNDRRTFVKRCTLVDENVARSSPSSSQSRNKRWQPDYDDDGKGLGDVEVETFLQSRVKRGRGSIGPKMDEPFPCLPVTELPTTSDTGDRKLVVQPERWPLLRHNTDSSSSSSSDDDEVHGRTPRKRKEHKQKLSKRHKSKDKKRDRKEKRREKKRRKHGRD